jgi:hypothetical protein
MTDLSGPTLTITEEMLQSVLAEGFHTAFRKGTYCPQAHQIWTLIQEMPGEDWGAVIDFVMDGVRGGSAEEDRRRWAEKVELPASELHVQMISRGTSPGPQRFARATHIPTGIDADSFPYPRELDSRAEAVQALRVKLGEKLKEASDAAARAQPGVGG